MNVIFLTVSVLFLVLETTTPDNIALLFWALVIQGVLISAIFAGIRTTDVDLLRYTHPMYQDERKTLIQMNSFLLAFLVLHVGIAFLDLCVFVLTETGIQAFWTYKFLLVMMLPLCTFALVLIKYGGRARAESL